MESVVVLKHETVPGGWKFVVRVGEGEHAQDHAVSIDRLYGEKLTGYKFRGVPDVQELVEKTFAFLLEREPKEVILREFDLATVQEFFPEYSYLMKGA